MKIVKAKQSFIILAVLWFMMLIPIIVDAHLSRVGALIFWLPFCFMIFYLYRILTP
ncbi:MAG: hypothetical protein WCT08_00800 [Patescibacteria group bacterium]|jgi:hypothetical protein